MSILPQTQTSQRGYRGDALKSVALTVVGFMHWTANLLRGTGRIRVSSIAEPPLLEGFL
jgi:hypothetical protein